MKRFLATLFALLMLGLTLTGCGESEASDWGPRVEDTNIRFPELVPEEIAELPGYRAAILLPNILVNYNGEVVTSLQAPLEFMEHLQKNEPAELFCYWFYPPDEKIVQENLIISYDGSKTCIEYKDAGIKKECLDVQMDEQGILSLHGADFILDLQTVNDRDLIDGYEELQPIGQKYMEPFLRLLIQMEAFEDAEELVSQLDSPLRWEILVTSLSGLEGEDFPVNFPHGRTGEDVADFLLRFLEIDRENLLHAMAPFLDENGCLKLEEPKSWSLPDQMLPVAFQQDGDIREITFRTRRGIDNRIIECKSETIRVRELSDGSLHLLSHTMRLDDPFSPSELLREPLSRIGIE